MDALNELVSDHKKHAAGGAPRTSPIDAHSSGRTGTEDGVELAPAICWQAFYSRDRRFDGRFFVGVVTTGVYCRPICPVPFAKSANVVWFASAAAAEADGFRPCLRCRPQASPGTPAWLGTSAVVSRALRLIWDGALDESNVDALAERLGIGSRQLRRLFVQHLGAPPIKIAGTRRIHFARKLIDETELPITEIAFSAGFKSIREFNHAMRAACGQSPRQLRRLRGEFQKVPGQEGLLIRLPYRPPFNWSALIMFLRQRATPGVELVREEFYRRTIEIGGAVGTIDVRPDKAEPCLLVRINLPKYECLLQVIERVRRIFDLTADPAQIADHLSQDPRLKPHLDAFPGLRVPGVWDGFEIAVRAILGQRLSVTDSNRVAGRLVRTFGKPMKTPFEGLTHLFPRPEELAEADLSTVGIRGTCAEVVHALSRSVCEKDLTFEAPRSLGDTISRMRTTQGVDEQVANYVAMRAFVEPDAFPSDDVRLIQTLAPPGTPALPAEILRIAESWRPWRAYAAMYLWAAGAAGSGRKIRRTLSRIPSSPRKRR
jgi:AraC family transcriptional regulator, regulatory protein of adaptative response / DNA-3-methyladenine glycosylase II